MQYVVDAISGVVLRWGSGGQDVLSGERLVELDYEVADPAGVYFVGDDPLSLPAKPINSPHLRWNGSDWIDPRTLEELQADLEAWRATRTLSKVEFLHNCMAYNLLTPDEAEAAATGGIPAIFVPLLDVLPAWQRQRARIDWPAATEVDRNDPLLVGLAQADGIEDAALDVLFGWTEGAPL